MAGKAFKGKDRFAIKTVTFRSMVSVGSYQNVHIEASADVPAGTDPSVALDKVKAFVARELLAAKDGRRPAMPAEGRFSDMLK